MRASGTLNRFVELVRCRGGNFAISFAILIPVLMGLTGAVVDFAVFQRQQANMQQAADTAALSAAKEMTIDTWSPTVASAVAKSYVDGNLGGIDPTSSSQYSVSAAVDKAAGKVKVNIDMDQYQYFVLGYFLKSPQIHVSATANAAGEAPVCVVGLDAAAASTIAINNTASVVAPACVSYSNSIDPKGIVVKPNAVLQTAATCSAGGFNGGSGSFLPVPTTDCPSLGDPLADRVQPVVGACDFQSYSAPKKAASILNPGVYCDGMLIDNGADVLLKPGVYIINGGTLLTKNNGTLKGTGVTLFFTGTDGHMNFDGSTIVSLSAPETGPTAGLLVMQDRAMGLQDFEMSSKSAAELLGTIYLPNGKFVVRANNKIAESSAFTIIVARFIEISNKSKLYVNANYDLTKVPVPAGFGPSAKVKLSN
jgi:Flp pilus assembly protein TadG